MFGKDKKSKLRICCVYQIYNRETRKRYIGGTTDFFHRRWQHLSDLRKGKHYSKSLQEDYAKFGEASLIFYILEEPKKEKLNEAEQFWLDMIKPEYNTSRFSSVPDSLIVHTEEARKKRSDATKLAWANGEYKHLIGRTVKWKSGKPPNLGKRLTSEQRQHLSEINKGKNNPNWGKHRSKESRNKLAKTYNGAISPDGTIYSPIINMQEFCREHNLDSGSISRLLNGKINGYKGWKRIQD